MRLSDRASVFGRFGWRDLNTVDQAPIPLPAGGGGNGSIYAQNKQLALGSTYVLGDASLLEARFGWSTTRGGKNPPALGSTSALDEYGITPANCRRTAVADHYGLHRARPPVHEPAMAIPDGLQPEGELHDADRTPVD